MSRLLRGTLLAVATSFCVITVAPPAVTQPSGVEQNDARKGNRRKARRRLEKLRNRVLKRKVGLSDEKVAQVVTILEGQQAERHALQKKIRASRKAIGALFRSDSEDQQAYAKHLDELQDAHRSLAELRDEQIDELGKVLEPKQQAKLFRAMEMVKRRFEKRRRNRRERKRR